MTLEITVRWRLQCTNAVSCKSDDLTVEGHSDMTCFDLIRKQGWSLKSGKPFCPSCVTKGREVRL